MPRIHQRLVGTSLYLYMSVEAASKGEQVGGTGVLIGQPSEIWPHAVHLYAATNAHVIEHGGVVARAMIRDGTAKIFDHSKGDWILHARDDDVAICWLGVVPTDVDQEIQFVPRAWIVTPDDFGIAAARPDLPWSAGPVIAGEDAFSVVRFIGYDGLERNQPTVRFGSLSSPEIIAVSQRPFRDHDQESLLVEARSLAGYSGAPVFAYRHLLYLDVGTIPIDSALLLGVGWGHLKHPDDEAKEFDVEMQTPGLPTPGRYNSGMMTVVPGWKLTDLLDDPAVVAARRAYETEAATEG